MKLHCPDSLAGLKKISSSPQLMGQAAAVLEGLKQEQPQGLGCCMSDYNFASCWSWILFFTLLTPTSSLITAYPLTQLLYFFPSMSGPATSRDKISHPLDVSQWSPQPFLSESTAASCTEGKGATGDKPECAPWSKWWARLPGVKCIHPLTFPGFCQAITAETHQDILGEKQCTHSFITSHWPYCF